MFSAITPRCGLVKSRLSPSLRLMAMSTRSKGSRKPAKPRNTSGKPHGGNNKSHNSADTTSSKLEGLERSLWRKQLVLDHYDIPGKYLKFFTGRLRKREKGRMERELSGNNAGKDGGDSQAQGLKRVAARSITVDDDVQARKIDIMRGQILRILERHLASENLPVRQLSLQYWEITDVLVSFNLKTAICCYKVTTKTAESNIQPFQVRKIIRESTEYLNLVVNEELAKGVSRGIGAPRTIRLKFTNSTSTSKLLEKMQAEIDTSDDQQSARLNNDNTANDRGEQQQ
ncbi:hypothetical protein GGI15_002451 [Coemansia interrupta]|uniref:Uncharacterized protein n=1 Tax=Coemansia interrupta TaxID=1126814 RepID=A0A9W8HGZ6_9FUNG|nr:hypothetical protein GGI15_002451 [Coemansia interrupta]